MFVITGGGSGIGRALTHTLAKRGHRVLIVGRRLDLLQETAAYSDLISVCKADVSTPRGRTTLIEALQSASQITALVNNAGTLQPIAPLLEMQLADWQQAFSINLDAALALPQALYSKLTDGRVLNIGSGAAYFPIAGWSAYCSSKAALAMLTRCWQVESDSVAFASVMPGIVDTDMQALARESKHIEAKQQLFYKRLKTESLLVSVDTLSLFLSWLLLTVDAATYSAREWDIYDTSHHVQWLIPPHTVPQWGEQ